MTNNNPTNNQSSVKRAVLYLRVSSQEQIDNSSLETQERSCTNCALSNGYEIDRVFVEKGESAKTADRTELKALLDYVGKNAKGLSVIIVYKIDRLARNTLDHAQLKLFFNNFGLRLISATENLEDSPVGRLIENQLAGFAQFDNEIRAERCKSGMISAVKQGRWVWKAPLGYHNIGKESSGTSTIEPISLELSKGIRRIWELIDCGLTPEEARQAVTKEGLKSVTDRVISKAQFYSIIRNKVYTGVIEKFGLSIVAGFKPIVEAELFLRVQDKLNGKGRKLPIYRKDNPDFPLRGLLLHSPCDKLLTGSWSTGNGGRYAHYHCSHCPKCYYGKTDVENLFLELLRSYNYKPQLKTAMAIAIEANLEYKHRNKGQRIEQIEREVIQLKAKAKQIAEKNFSNVISDQMAKEMLSDNEAKTSELLIELAGCKTNQESTIEIVEYSLSILEDMSQVWLKIELDIKKRFQKFLFPDGLPYNGSKFGTAKTALCIEPKWQVTVPNYAMVDHTRIELVFLQCECSALPLC